MREASILAPSAVLHTLQVEEQELAICSGRRSINKNTTFKEKRRMHCQKTKKIKQKIIYRRSRKLEKKIKKKKIVRRCTKHIDYNKACDL